MFQRMVIDEPNLSGAGRETLLALYDGPLHLRQILDIVNTPERSATDGGAKDQNISESALRKRLDVLITRGMITRAGSERTNPYYYLRIRRTDGTEPPDRSSIWSVPEDTREQICDRRLS